VKKTLLLREEEKKNKEILGEKNRSRVRAGGLGSDTV